MLPDVPYTVDTISELKALDVSSMTSVSVEVKGYFAVGDGGGGYFSYASTSTEADDGGLTIAPDAGDGRWLRLWDGSNIFAAWFGMMGASKDTPLASVPDDTVRARRIFGWQENEGIVHRPSVTPVGIHFAGSRQYRFTSANFTLTKCTTLNGHGAWLAFDTGNSADCGFLVCENNRIENIGRFDWRPTGAAGAYQYAISNYDPVTGQVGQTSDSPCINVTISDINFIPQQAGCRGEGFIEIGGATNLLIENIRFSGTHTETEEAIKIFWAGAAKRTTSGLVPGNNIVIRNITGDSFSCKYPEVGGAGCFVGANCCANVLIEGVSVKECIGKVVTLSQGDWSFEDAEPPTNKWRNNFIVRNVTAGGFQHHGITLNGLLAEPFPDNNTYVLVENCVLNGVGASNRNGIQLYDVSQAVIRGCHITGWERSINISGNSEGELRARAQNVRIENCILRDAEGDAIWIENCDDAHINANSIFGYGAAGVRLYNELRRPVVMLNSIGRTGGAEHSGIVVEATSTIEKVIVRLNHVINSTTPYYFGSGPSYADISQNYLASFNARYEGLFDGMLRSNSEKTFIGTHGTPAFPQDWVGGATRVGADDIGVSSIVRNADVNQDWSLLISQHTGSSYLGIVRASATVSENILRWGNGQGAKAATRQDFYAASAVNQAGGVVARYDKGDTATQTAMLLMHDGTLKRVEVGASDSGGTGYRILRLIN